MTNRHRHTLIKADIPSSPSCVLLEVSPAPLLRPDWRATPCLWPRKCVPRGHSTGQGGRRCLHWQSNIGLDRFLESNTQIHPILLLDNSKYLYFPPFSLQFWVRKKKLLRKMISLNFSKNVLDILSICFCSDDQICFNYLLVVFLLFSDSLWQFWQSLTVYTII